MVLSKTFIIITILGLILTGCSVNTENTNDVELTHVHGLGYSPDGEQLVIPAHDGLRAYADGHWHIPDGAKHDYMGFSMVDDGFYSSGHPEPGSNLKNPFGLVKSTDLGKSIEMIDLYGEVDFHDMAVGYHNHVIYVINHEPNSRMIAVGLYYTSDSTETWRKSDMKGLEGEQMVLAVHPVKENTVAIGSEKGLFVSTDYGNHFTKVHPHQVTALHYNQRGDLLVGGFNGKPFLLQFDNALKQTAALDLPPLEKDAVAYIAQNPKDEKELAIATFNKHVFLTQDVGTSWVQIADQGEGNTGAQDGHDHQH